MSRMIRSASFLVVALTGALWAQGARAQDPGDLASRMDRIEQALRDLTGTVEQLQYRNQQLEQQVRRLQGADTRPDGSRAASMPPGPPPVAGAPATVTSAVPPEQGSPPLQGRGDAFNPMQNPSAPGVPRPLGSSTSANEPPPPYEPPAGGRAAGSPLNLATMSNGREGGGGADGALPPPPPRTLSATGAMASTTMPPGSTPKDQYDLAYGYVLHRDYGLAANAFRAYLREYPSDRMASEAQYWLGESLFQQQQYREAAESFLAVSTKYESTARAPEALLRLGQSLGALGEKEAACASLGEVTRKYPHASQNVRQSVEREQKRVHC
jgi:tol-pal system protein YbgF